MKILKFTLLALSVTVCSFCGLLIFSNPSPRQYEDFAIQEISLYLQKEGCGKLTSDQPSLQAPCQSVLKLLLDTSKQQIKELITQNTQQQNFLFFSIYRTTLALPAPLPNYEVETLGILQNFYIYQAQEIR